MKTGGGDFSPEAYQQLREAYDKEQQRQVDDEVKGTQLMGQQYSLETVPVDSPWADKIDLWEYPNGKQPHLDEKQSPDEILQIMRDAAQERINAKEEDTEEEEAEEIVDEDDSEEEVSEDEEFEDEDEEEEGEDESEDEETESEIEDDSEETAEEDESYDPEELAAQIAELKAEIEEMSFIPENPVEEPADDE